LRENWEMMCVKPTVGERVSEILSSEKRGSLPREMLDVLRMLVVYNGTGWKSELVRELHLFHAFRGEPEAVDEIQLEGALRRLEGEGLVKVEKRVRGDMGPRGGVEDELITLADISATRNALAEDRVLSSYMREQITFSR
jgi:hypothetical protein